MIIALIGILIALTFGFVFAKIDTLTKICKILKSDVEKLQSKFEKIEKHN